MAKRERPFMVAFTPRTLCSMFNIQNPSIFQPAVYGLIIYGLIVYDLMPQRRYILPHVKPPPKAARTRLSP